MIANSDFNDAKLVTTIVLVEVVLWMVIVTILVLQFVHDPSTTMQSKKKNSSSYIMHVFEL